jgi:hypothetical protein
LLAGHCQRRQEGAAAVAGNINAWRRAGCDGKNFATRRARNLLADEMIFGGEALAAAAGYNYWHTRGGIKWRVNK